MPADPTRPFPGAIQQEMRDAFIRLGKSLIPLLGSTPEDIRTFIELGEIYENLGCLPEAIAVYEEAQRRDPGCFFETAKHS